MPEYSFLAKTVQSCLYCHSTRRTQSSAYLYCTPIRFAVNPDCRPLARYFQRSVTVNSSGLQYNTDRYDDRDVVITNLIESYDRLMNFGQKHLNDTFHLDGIQSVSARDNILREIISNLLAHRDFSNAYVVKLNIEKNRIFTENANLSHGHGSLDPATFEPFPKNPPISKVFREIGMADELGSGMRNTYKYTRMYSGANPQFVEGDIFRITIPLIEAATATVGFKGTVPHGNIINQIYEIIKENPHITRKEIGMRLGISTKTVGRKIKDIDNIKYVGSGNNGHWEINENTGGLK